jgi:hypothetical protein
MSRTFDKQFELKAAGAVTVSGDEPLILCKPRRLGSNVTVEINISAVSGTTPTLAPYINVSPTVGGAKTRIVQLPNITGVGKYVIPLSAELVAQHDAAAEALGIGWTVGGTTPSFTVQAFITSEK